MVLRRALWIGAAIVVAWLLLSLLAFWLWTSGESAPGSGEGDVITVQTTP